MKFPLIIRFILYTIIIILIGAISTLLFSVFLTNQQFIAYNDLIKLVSLASGLIVVLLISKSTSLLLTVFKKPIIDLKKCYKVLFYTLVFLLFNYIFVVYIINDRLLVGDITVIRLFQIILLIPFLEEIVFRGVFQNRLTQKYGWKLGIIVSSLLFVAIHYGVFHQMLVSLIFSVFAGYIFFKTDSLMCSILFHVLVNVGIVILSLSGY